jgi:hypothetical protein
MAEFLQTERQDRGWAVDVVCDRCTDDPELAVAVCQLIDGMTARYVRLISLMSEEFEGVMDPDVDLR